MGLADQPRINLATLPTPLQEATRLRDALGGASQCPKILIKRDDLTGLAFGGNKARKLEFLVADALKQGATWLVTAGAVQSNHARMTAAAARLASLGVTLVLTTKVERPLVQGNLLLDRLLEADICFIPDGASTDEAMEEVAVSLRARGERPYSIPVGGSNAIGTLGYVVATEELLGQLAALGESVTRLYYASGSRGTQAGIILGAKIFRASYRVQGIGVSPGEAEKRPRAMQLVREGAALLGLTIDLTDADLLTDEGHIGQGYGIATADCLEAIRLLARYEAIFLDPVYSGKAMAGLIADIRSGDIAPDETVVFLHTGGNPALFAQAEALGL